MYQPGATGVKARELFVGQDDGSHLPSMT